MLFISCKTDLESIQGHWHHIPNSKTNTYRTLDIEDSLIYINKYDKSGRYNSSKIEQDGEVLIARMGSYGEYYMSSKIILKSDTLILIEFSSDSGFETGVGSIWFRAKNDLNDIRQDISSNLLVKVILAIDNTSFPFDSIGLYNNWGMINIGYPKFNNDKYPKDSLLIHANEAIGDFSDIDDYFEATLHMHSDKYNDSIVAIINADINTPDIYFDSIFYYLEHSQQVSSVYRTYLNDDFNGLGLKKLQ